MIYTFYSYKGGVGRSMALANVAEWLYRQGLRVVMIDWDLEAPGLESYFYQSPEELEEVRSQLGLIDMLTAYKRMFPRLPLPRAAAQPADGGDGDRRAATLAALQEHLPPVTPMLHPVHAPGSPGESGAAAPQAAGGALWLLPAGWRGGDRFANYAQAVQDFNWSDFYASYEGEAYFEWLRRQLTAEDLADLVLIDSRTGVTEMGGVCTRQLADVVVSFCVPNLQNLNGAEVMAQSFRRPDITAKRGCEPEVVMVPTRIDVSELDARNNFERQFRARLDGFTPPAFATVQSSFWDLAIQYIPKYAYTEKLAINAPNSARELEDAYKKLAAHLVLLAGGEAGARVRRRYSAELQRVFGTLLPSLVISYADEEGRRAADELRRRLPDHGVSAWPELPSEDGREDWGQMTGLLDQSRSLVMVVTPGARLSEGLRHQWQYARQQGVAVFLVTAGGAGPEAQNGAWPRWARESHRYDLGRDWEALVRLLQSPPQVARVPFMAPDLPANYVARPQEIGRLKDVLLSGGGQPRPGTVGLWGPAGCGKQVLAAALCHDEDAVAHFGDGILWATLGAEPNVMAELTKLHAALAGERPQFVDEEEAAKQLALRLGERNCLMVIDDAWDLKHLKPFLSGGPRCKRLVLTYNLGVLTGAGAEVVSPEDLTAEEAVALLTAQLNLPPEEAARFAPFTERLGRWPLALKLANAQLRKLLGQGLGVGGALDHLNQALDKLGVLAFDQPGVGDSDESAARSLGLTLSYLTEAERERFLEIAFLPEGEAVTPARLGELWRLDEFETGKLLQHFADLALLKYDLVTKTVRLDTRLRDYILNPASGYDLNGRYEAAFNHLRPESRAHARRALTRLVRLALPNEKAGDSLLTARLSEFDPAGREALSALMDARLVEAEGEGDRRVVQLAGEEVLRRWARLRDWLSEDREFLLWRQSLCQSLAEWERHHDRGALLSGGPLHLATKFQQLRAADLNRAEHDYIDASQEAEREARAQLQAAEETKQVAAQSYQQLQRTRRWGLILGVGALAVLLPAGGYLWWAQRAAQQAALAEQREVQAVRLTAEGLILAGEGRRDEAIASYEQAIRLKPDYDKAYANLGDALRGKGDYDRAILAYGRALDLGLRDAVIYRARGQLYANRGAHREAVADYNQAIALDPGNANLYADRGTAYQILGLKAEGEADLAKARALTAATPEPSAAPTASPGPSFVRVFLHYNDPGDNRTVLGLARSLRAKGYDVKGPELRPEKTAGDVRYFNADDRARAREISARVRQFLAAAKAPLEVEVIFVNSGKYAAPSGQLEVWLPPLPKPPPVAQTEQKAPAPQKPVRRYD